MNALSADYAFGLRTQEKHRETVATFNPWVAQYMANHNIQPTIPPLPTEDIYFTNFFISRISWWGQPRVQQFLRAVNASGGIYEHRWGDAPIQTAALRLHATPSAVMQIDVDYVQLSTQNRIIGGKEVKFSAESIVNPHFRRLVGISANDSASCTPILRMHSKRPRFASMATRALRGSE
eukprot:3777742-Prymnesium_polylepis.1